MPKTLPADEAPDAPPDLSDDSSVYEIPSELDDTIADDGGGAPPQRRGARALEVAAAAAVVLVAGGALLAYRAHHRAKVLEEGLARAEGLLRLDTAAGYRGAASLLEPLVSLDPDEAGSVRAFALAMLFADYRQAAAADEAEALLVAPGRADVVPAYAHLASAALALGRREAGTATTAAARAGEGPWAGALKARIAFLAGNVEASLEPAAAAATEGGFAPGLALHGDALRRSRRDPAGARTAYEAALAASPKDPRAAYGLAKLALAGQAPSEPAAAALERLLDDREATPAPERGRAALHLAALRIRAGDRAGAGAALDAADLDGPARAWASRAAAVASGQRGPYRAVSGAPAALRSASDDDPPELSPEPPPPPAPPKVAAKRRPASRKAIASKQAAAKKAAAKRSAAVTKRKPAAIQRTAAKRKPAATRAATARTTAPGRARR